MFLNLLLYSTLLIVNQIMNSVILSLNEVSNNYDKSKTKKGKTLIIYPYYPDNDMMHHSAFFSGQSVVAVQSELLVDLGVVFSVGLGHVGSVGPSAVVEGTPSDLQLVIRGVPSWNHVIGEKFMSLAQFVALVEFSIYDSITLSALSDSGEFDVGDLFSEAVGFSHSVEVEFVLSGFGFDFELFVVDFVVFAGQRFDIFAIEVKLDTAGSKIETLSAGVVELQGPLISKTNNWRSRGSSILLTATTLFFINSGRWGCLAWLGQMGHTSMEGEA